MNADKTFCFGFFALFFCFLFVLHVFCLVDFADFVFESRILRILFLNRGLRRLRGLFLNRGLRGLRG